MVDPGFEELLAHCASEPIHAPGAVQPHGLLVGTDEAGRISVVSDNSEVIAGVAPPSLLGEGLVALFGATGAARLHASEDGEVSYDVAGPQGLFDVVAHRAGDLDLFEVEPTSKVELGDRRLFHALRSFHGARSVDALVARTADAVRELTGFDRVLVYRFDPEWNGEVVAEAAREDIDSFLGLRFPASDIPPQARALYSRALLRLIPDSSAAQSPLLAVDDASAAALDLSDVALRAVSPVHLVYLRNMGVDASMSVAMMLGDRLWGLVACHHLEGRRCPSVRVRNAVDLVARTTSTVLAALLDAQGATRRLELARVMDELTLDHLDPGAGDATKALAARGSELAALLQADGAAVVTRGEVAASGVALRPAVLRALLAAADEDPAGVLVSDELRRTVPDLADELGVVAGALVVPVVGGDRFLVWLRSEVSRSVRWGGDPDAKAVAPDPSGQLRLTPRSSFREYVEVVRGRSEPWQREEVEVAQALGQRLGNARAAQARHEAALAATLQRTVLLERLPVIRGVDSHVLYLPSEGGPLGGDWYDVFFRPSGAPTLALGDVAGHGADAASTMAQLRHALRAYVVRETSPARAMTRLNELMFELLPAEMASALLVELDPIGHTAEIVNAGHLPALVLDADGARFVEGHHGPALGLDRGATYRSTRVDLAAGATLLLYTDGLIERRGESIDDSLARLASTAARLSGAPLVELCATLRDTFPVGDGVDDDRTVLAVRFDGSTT